MHRTGTREEWLAARLKLLEATMALNAGNVARAEELRAKWGTERGQLWEIGRHRLLCGDSTSHDEMSSTPDEVSIQKR